MAIEVLTTSRGQSARASLPQGSKSRVASAPARTIRCSSHPPSRNAHAACASTSKRALLLAGAAVLAGWRRPEAAKAEAAAASGYETVYFGNGCFWGRQKDFVDVELQMGRQPEQLSAVVGYAGGVQAGPNGSVCYYYSDPRTIYEGLGHAEVVSVALDGDADTARSEFAAFVQRYFDQFVPTPRGMQRQDPQDAGAGYRNVVGIPGGVDGDLFPLLKEANKRGMELRPGRGNMYERGRPREGDELNVVWVYDSTALPFYRAERYHQFHNGLGKAFPAAYTRDLKQKVARSGKIDPTGCPELPF